jgi:hypothetical protein
MKMGDLNGRTDVYELKSEIQDGTKKQPKQEENSMAENMGSVEGVGVLTCNNNEEEYKPSEKWRIMKNIVVISLAFMVHFTAFQGAGNLQSSVNADEGLGTVSLATIYLSLILSNVFLPVVMIRSVIYVLLLHLALVRVVLYGCETWSLTLKEEHRLRVFENIKINYLELIQSPYRRF